MDLKSICGMESSKLGCQLKVGDKGETGIKGIAKAVTWVTQRNKEMSKRSLLGFGVQQANQVDVPLSRCYLRLELSKEAETREVSMEFLVYGCRRKSGELLAQMGREYEKKWGNWGECSCIEVGAGSSNRRGWRRCP